LNASKDRRANFLQEERLHLRERKFSRSKEIKMFKNRFVLIPAALSMLMVTLAVSRPFSKPPKTVDLSLPPRPVILPVTGAEDQPSGMDSATRSYIAWGLALRARDDIRALCR
jgi:hypothetical protein